MFPSSRYEQVGDEFSLRSPAPEPPSDYAEQLVTLRVAIATFRVEANRWRLAGLAQPGQHFDRRADVLEHVLRRLAQEGDELRELRPGGGFPDVR